MAQRQKEDSAGLQNISVALKAVHRCDFEGMLLLDMQTCIAGR